MPFLWKVQLNLSVYDRFFYSPQCTDMYSKEKFSIAIFLPCVLIYQKHEISLLGGYKTVRPKQETGNDCDVISGLQASRKTDFSVIFLLWALFIRKKENVEEICFYKAWSPEMTSHLFLVSCFWFRDFVSPRNEILVFGTSKHREGKSLSNLFFALLISTLGRFNRHSSIFHKFWLLTFQLLAL